jgi:hypothetical protein
MYVLMMFGWVFVVSYMIKMSSTCLVYSAMFFVSSSCFMCVSSWYCKNISAIWLDIGDPMDTPPDDERLSLETCRGRKINTLGKK